MDQESALNNEQAILTEIEMLEQMVQLHKEKQQAEITLKNLSEEYGKLEARLSKHMLDSEIDSTAKYDGVGFATLEKPKLFARSNVGDKEKLFGFLSEIGRTDLIKQEVHYASLTSLVEERIAEKGTVAIPDFINYGYVRRLRLYPRP